jgi:hypothetical protein
MNEKDREGARPVPVIGKGGCLAYATPHFTKRMLSAITKT